MGFMDKIKEASQNVAAEAKKATAQGKEKLGDMQAKKKMDEAAKKIGYLVYRERTEGTPQGTETDTLVAEMKDCRPRSTRTARPQRLRLRTRRPEARRQRHRPRRRSRRAASPHPETSSSKRVST